MVKVAEYFPEERIVASRMQQLIWSPPRKRKSEEHWTTEALSGLAAEAATAETGKKDD
jgi:hypothetical protein